MSLKIVCRTEVLIYFFDLIFSADLSTETTLPFLVTFFLYFIPGFLLAAKRVTNIINLSLQYQYIVKKTSEENQLSSSREYCLEVSPNFQRSNLKNARQSVKRTADILSLHGVKRVDLSRILE